MAETARNPIDRKGGASGKVGRAIEARRAVLQRWCDEGVPHGDLRHLPTSLTKARLWADPGRGIVPMTSPTPFTCNHPVHGDAVSEIKRLIDALRERYGLGPKRTRSGRPAMREVARLQDVRPPAVLKASDPALRKAVDQWHAERARCSELSKQLADALMRLERKRGAARPTQRTAIATEGAP